MKKELQILHEELSSARLIIKLLQTEGNAVSAIGITTNQETNNDARNEWKTVLANKDGTSRPNTVQQPQPIPTIINRYKVLENLHIQPPTHQKHKHASSLPTAIKEYSSATKSVSMIQQTGGSVNNKKKTQAKKRSKIIIIRDSHARGCVMELRHNLKQDYEIQGIVNLGASLQMIVNAPMESLGKLTKKDVIVVWGGMRDVGRNKSGNGLRQIRNCVENLKQTNVIVMSVPHRHDLAPNSCVNQEVKVYNRKLIKHLKVQRCTKIRVC